MSQITLLYNLQQIDTEIEQKKKRLRQVLRTKGETDELIAARKRSEVANQAWEKLRQQQQALERDVAIADQNIQSSSNRLYSGNVKNPKELTDLQNKIDSVRRHRSALEDEILEIMILREEAEEEKAVSTEAWVVIQANWEKEQAKLLEEEAVLTQRLRQLLGQRSTQQERIDAPLLTEYDQLRERRGGVGVSGLKRGVCQACQVTLSATIAKRAEEGELAYCDSCGRILNPI